MIVITDGRQTGRTTALLRWLIGGHPVDGWPGWSRVLIVATARDAQRIIVDYPELQHELRHRFTPALGKLVISVHELPHVLHVADPAVAYAVDNADWIIEHALGVRPAVLTIEGVATDPDDPIDPGPDDEAPIPFRPTLAGFAATMPAGGA